MLQNISRRKSTKQLSTANRRIYWECRQEFCSNSKAKVAAQSQLFNLMLYLKEFFFCSRKYQCLCSD